MNNKYLQISVVVICLFTSFSIAFAHNQITSELNNTISIYKYLLLINNQGLDFKLWQNELRKAGYNATHWFPPSAAIYRYHTEDELINKDNIPALIYKNITQIESSYYCSKSSEICTAIHSFMKLINMKYDDNIPLIVPIDTEKSDALIIPDQELMPKGACNATGLKRSGSEYLLGNISVNVILVESNGAIDASTENWSAIRESQVTSKITAAMNFLSSAYNLNTNLTPSFTYHYYFGRTNTVAQTSYEPINRAADPTNEPGSGEGLWTNEIYNKLGYSSLSNRWIKGQEFNGDTRNNDGTDWAFTIFVIDSLNDTDGMFTDGWFAYAWLGGPHLVMTYDNDNWGISNMDVVARHETSHIFYALDEYASSQCYCTQVSGYINYQNQNCENNCLYNGNCIMSSASKQMAGVICYYTRGHIGYGDADADLVPDPIDIPPETSLIPYSPDPTTNPILTYQGQADIQKLTNQNLYNYQCDINILHINAVYYRVNGGSWTSAAACDGNYDSASECYTFTIGPLSPGTYTIDTMAVDELNQSDPTPATDTVTILSSNLPGEPTILKIAKNTSNPNSLDLSWVKPGINCDQTATFGVFVGMIPTLQTGNYDHQAFVCNINNNSVTIPDPGPINYILVVAHTATTEGSYGRDKSGAERPKSNSPCTPNYNNTPC